MEFSAGFKVIGEDQEEAFDLAAAAPAKVVPIDQDLFEEDGDWNPGEKVGEAHGTAVVTQKRLAMCHISFTFGEEDSIVAHGVLPIDGSTLGDGHIAVAGGTGRFDKATGRADLETLNPKRWSFAL